MNPDQKRILKACRAICQLVGGEALIRIDISNVQDKEDGKPSDPWLQRQQKTLLTLLRELEEAEI